MTIAIVGCMDRRLNAFFEEARNELLTQNPSERVYIIRDAGGGVSAVERTLYGLNVTEIHDYTHTNCGAMKVAMAACSKINSGDRLDDIEKSADVYDSSIRPFLGKTYDTPLAIEQKNTEVQKEELKHLKMTHPDLKFTCEMIEVEKLNVPSAGGEYTVIIGMAHNGKYSDIANKYNLDLSSIYFVQADHLEEIRASVKLAVEKLNIHNVMFVSNDSSEDETIEQWSSDPTLREMFDRHLMQVPLKMQKPKK